MFYNKSKGDNPFNYEVIYESGDIVRDNCYVRKWSKDEKFLNEVIKLDKDQIFPQINDKHTFFKVMLDITECDSCCDKREENE